MAGVVGRQGARKESASHGRRVTRPECITGFMKRFCRVASPPGGVGAAGGGGREGERIVLNCSRRIKTICIQMGKQEDASFVASGFTGKWRGG